MGRDKFELEDQVILITGASQGLGREFASKIFSATKRTKVIIVSRSESKLIKACETIAKFVDSTGSDTLPYHHLREYSTYVKNDSTSLNGNRLFYAACDLSDADAVENSLQPLLLDVPVTKTFFTAGGAVPKMFKQLTLKELSQGVDMNYLSALFLSKVILSKINTCHHLLFFSSEVAFFPFIGYSQYAPMKTALKSLIGILRQEYPEKRISTIYPGNFVSEGYEEEIKVKSEITKEIEGPSFPISCEECCDKILAALAKGYDDITTDLIGWALMSVDMGLNKNWNNSYLWGVQLLLGVIANLIIVPIYMVVVTYQINSWMKKQEQVEINDEEETDGTKID